MVTSTPTYSDLFIQIAAKQAETATEFKAILDEALPKLAALAAQLEEPVEPKSAVKNQLDAVVATLTSYASAVAYYIPAPPAA